jgi:AbrB family looped-hinge helix DNA binding protein
MSKRRAAIARLLLLLDPSREVPSSDGKYHGIMACMTTTLTVDKAGRIVLPKPVRDELQLMAGDSLALESSEEGIMLRPVRGTEGLRKKQGIWVLRTGQPLSTSVVDDTLRQIRLERGGNRSVPKSTSGRTRKSR